MVDDDKAGHDKPGDAPKPGEPATDEKQSSVPSHGTSQSLEWTASDGRGPLERAEEDEKTEAAARAREADHSTPGGSAAEPAEPTPDADTTSRPTDDPTRPASIPTDPVARRSGRSLWPLAAAIILGAVIGAGSAYIDGLYLQGGSANAPDVSSLSARVDALEKRPDPQAAIGEIRSSVTALANKIAALQKGADTDNSGAAPASKPVAPQTDAAPQTVDLGPVNQKLAALQSEVDGLKGGGSETKALQEKIAALEGTLAGMKPATAAAQAGVTSMEGEQKALAGRVTVPALAVVADSLVQQIDQGQPYAAQVDALAALGVDPAKVAVLRANADKGVASSKSLAAKFEPLAEPIATATRKPPANAGFMDRLKSGALNLVSIRRADDTSGDDLPSRVARIKSALAHDDVPGALATWEALPADAKAKSAEWGALAKASADAMSAARALQHDAIVALGAKKS